MPRYLQHRESHGRDPVASPLSYKHVIGMPTSPSDKCAGFETHVLQLVPFTRIRAPRSVHGIANGCHRDHPDFRYLCLVINVTRGKPSIRSPVSRGVSTIGGGRVCGDEHAIISFVNTPVKRTPEAGMPGSNCLPSTLVVAILTFWYSPN